MPLAKVLKTLMSSIAVPEEAEQQQAPHLHAGGVGSRLFVGLARGLRMRERRGGASWSVLGASGDSSPYRVSIWEVPMALILVSRNSPANGT